MKKTRDVVAPMMEPVAGVFTGGILKDRTDKNRENLFMRIDPEAMGRVFAEVHDPYYAEPEFCGKYLDTAMALYRTTGDGEILKRAMVLKDAIVAHQRRDGYLGTYREGKEFDETFSVWNQNFVIMGLVSVYETTGDEAALKAATRCADYIATSYMKRGGPDIYFGLSQGIVNFSVINQMPRLYRLTGKKLYLDFSRFLLDKMESSTLKLVSIPLRVPIPTTYLGSTKGIELFICYQGLLELYRVTGEEDLLRGSAAYWEALKNTQIGITGCGTIAEAWTYLYNTPVSVTTDLHPNENCVAVGWIKTALRLYGFTGEAKYFDAIDRTLFNHLLGSQALDGRDFSYYQGLAGRKVHEKDPGMYSCCRYRGLNVLALLPHHLYARRGENIFVNLYAPSRAETSIGKMPLLLEQKTDFPCGGEVNVEVSPESPKRFALHLRIPEWCAEWRIAVNGRRTDSPADKGYVSLEREWKKGDSVTLSMTMPVGVRRWAIDGEDSAAISYGPLVLAMDSRYGTPIQDCEILLDGEEPRLEREGDGGLAPMVRFAVRGRYRGEERRITLVDYASAGSIDPEKDRFRVWIPVAK